MGGIPRSSERRHPAVHHCEGVWLERVLQHADWMLCLGAVPAGSHGQPAEPRPEREGPPQWRRRRCCHCCRIDCCNALHPPVFAFTGCMHAWPSAFVHSCKHCVSTVNCHAVYAQMGCEGARERNASLHSPLPGSSALGEMGWGGLVCWAHSDAIGSWRVIKQGLVISTEVRGRSHCSASSSVSFWEAYVEQCYMHWFHVAMKLHRSRQHSKNQLCAWGCASRIVACQAEDS